MTATSRLPRKIDAPRACRACCNPTATRCAIFGVICMQVVVCSLHRYGTGSKTPTFQPAEGFAHDYVYYHHDKPSSDPYFAGAIPTREAGCFFAHASRRYNELANMTVFVHEDVAAHNPVWPRWLECLRPNASHASLVRDRRSNSGLHACGSRHVFDPRLSRAQSFARRSSCVPCQ